MCFSLSAAILRAVSNDAKGCCNCCYTHIVTRDNLAKFIIFFEEAIVRIVALKSYCMMLCTLLYKTLCMT